MTNENQNEWWEPLVKEVMAHRQSDPKYHWTACVCCARSLNHLAPKIISESRRQARAELKEEVIEIVKKERGEPSSYSYYIPSSSTPPEDFNGYWKQVSSFEDIPRGWRERRNFWHKHYENEGQLTCNNILSRLKSL